LRPKEGKTHFTVMDFRNVARLFADPEWDGPIIINPGFDPEPPTNPPKPPEPPIDPPPGRDPIPYVDREGCRVSVINKTVSIYDPSGRLLRQESIIDYTKSNILGTYASLDNFIHQWSAEQKKIKIQELFRARGIDLDALKEDQGMSNVDDFDFICHIAFDKKPLTRRERANNVKKRDFLSKYSGVAREVLEMLLDLYMNAGIYEIEDMNILRLDPVKRLGSPAKIVGAFGGRDAYLQAVKELEKALYEVA